uniref:N-acetyltransferase domain-containing protein n=1 Tax=Timema poppense TaxID=170557 RepID=A0A7R9DF94_TIMPO|nr:unnamed protein product [Timema poppensis]
MLTPALVAAWAKVLLSQYKRLLMMGRFRYEKYTQDGSTMYAVVGYMTVYQYYAYPKNIRPRISQMLVLPPYQRRGLGEKLLSTMYQHYINDNRVVDITGDLFYSRSVQSSLLQL